jgi:hypothetical protein
MPTEKINYSDNLKEGTDKLNQAIDQANKAETDSSKALSTANQSLNNSQNTQNQLNQVVIEGDSSVEAAQARVNRFTGSNDTLNGRITHLETRINVKMPPFNAKGDGATNDTAAIQAAIDYANTNSIRNVFMPEGNYLISAPILLNGCSLEGVQTNIYNTTSNGSTFTCSTKDFIAVKQGSLAANDIQFTIKNIMVKNALIGFEINYAINTRFDWLYAKDCDTGYKLGDPTAVGSMFCEFNNFYTSGCRIGAIVQAKEYWNNNRFNNGFIQGTEKAFHLEVTGGYGAVNNVFNNVELKSSLGRGIILRNALNTTFNSPYFECGGNAIRTVNFCTINLNEPVFGMYKVANTNSDKSFVYAEGGFRLKLDGGVIFLTAENDNTSFYEATDPLTYQNVYMNNPIQLNGAATNFQRFKQAINEMSYKKEEQVLSTSVVTVPAGGGYVDVTWTYPTPFSKSPEVVIPVLRGNDFELRTLSWGMAESTATGGKIRIYNESASTPRNVYFRIHARTL